MIKASNMNYEKFNTNWNKPAIFTAQTYGTKTTVEIDHSDLDLNEVMDAFQTLINGMGYHSDAFKQWVIEKAEEYNEEDKEKSTFKDEEDEHRFYNEVKESIKKGLESYNKDSDGFEDYQNKNETKCYCGHTDYCDCGPEDKDLEWPEPNENLKDAAKKYSKVVKNKNK